MKKLYWIVGAIVAVFLIIFVLAPVFAGHLSIRPTIQLGPLTLRWYGIILAAGILAAYFVIRNKSWKFGISKNDVDDFSFWAIILAILGARIYYVLFNLNYFSVHPNEIYQIWHGGISIYGGVIAAIVFGYFYTRNKAYTFWQLGDLIVLGLPLGQAIGRFGNFINQEAFGTPTNLPWKMYVEPLHRPAQYLALSYFHPTFLYEALADIFIFILLNKLFGKVKSGFLFLIYLIVYSVFRFFIEWVRTDSLFLYGFRVDQLIAVCIIVVAAGTLYARR